MLGVDGHEPAVARGTVELPLGALAGSRAQRRPCRRGRASGRRSTAAPRAAPRRPPPRAGPPGCPGPSSRTETTHRSPRSSSSTQASASRPDVVAHVAQARLHGGDQLAGRARPAASPALPGHGDVHLRGLQPGQQPRRGPGRRAAPPRSRESCCTSAAQPHLLLPGQPAELGAVRPELGAAPLDQREHLEHAVVHHPGQALPLRRRPRPPARRGRARPAVCWSSPERKPTIAPPG